MPALQKRLAAAILKVGESRVWFDPGKTEEIKKAVTKADIRRLILKGAIKALPGKVRKRARRKPARKGPGKRKGGRYAKVTKKERWAMTARPLRGLLRELRDSGQIDSPTYRKLYKLVKGGMFRSRAHLRIYLEQHGLLKVKK